MSSAFLHTSVYHWAKSTSISVICSTCFLFSLAILSQSFMLRWVYPFQPFYSIN